MFLIGVNKQRYFAPSFMKKWSFNLCLKLLREFTNLRPIGKLFQTIGVRCDKLFWPESVFLKGCFSFEVIYPVYAWSWPDCVYISCKYRGQVCLKKLKALEQSDWLDLWDTKSQSIFSNSLFLMWFLLSSWRQY